MSLSWSYFDNCILPVLKSFNTGTGLWWNIWGFFGFLGGVFCLFFTKETVAGQLFWQVMTTIVETWTVRGADGECRWWGQGVMETREDKIKQADNSSVRSLQATLGFLGRENFIKRVEKRRAEESFVWGLENHRGSQSLFPVLKQYF